MDRRLILVTWLDSHSYEGWTAVKDLKPDGVTCRSVGWLISETEQTLTLAPHLTQADHASAEEQASGAMVIPRVSVVSIEDLAVP
jgi:hypothetical protein